MTYRALYRRYRPQVFGQLRGQDHVVATLRNAVRENRTAHAYLFSGPRGTGKTSTARILAKALNCQAVVEGEPCDACTSCTDIAEGRSLDVFELDAASNNGVEAMRDLVSRANLGTPGRYKVYIVDEAHMLSSAAANALLKTLEEPPAHVVFVLATTEARRVLPTIRSRTQHLEFRLLTAEALGDHLRWVAADAGLGLDAGSLDQVALAGKGSVRDALSALDQVAAAGSVEAPGPSVSDLADALADRDLPRALTLLAVEPLAASEPRQVAGDLVDHLRRAFLVTLSPQVAGVPAAAVAGLAEQARRLGRAQVVRAMELLGQALIDMRDGPDPRVCLDLALIRLCVPETDPAPAALLERIERLERRDRGPGAATADPDQATLAGGSVTAPAAGPGTAARKPLPPPPPRARPAGSSPDPTSPNRAFPPGPAFSGAATSISPVGPPTACDPSVPRAPVVATAGGQGRPPPGEGRPLATAELGGTGLGDSPVTGPAGALAPTRDALTLAWADVILDRLSARAKARFRVGRFVDLPEGRADDAAPDGAVGFALPNTIHRDRCAEAVEEVNEALSLHFASPVRLTLVVEADLVARPGASTGTGRAATGAPVTPTGGAAAKERDRPGPSVEPTKMVEATPPPPPEDLVDPEEFFDPEELTDAPPAAVVSPLQAVLEAFEGAVVVESPPGGR
ncbi:MAG: DNA polymerase III subunit gamma/tau [Acidimicrobiales bacterium]